MPEMKDKLDSQIKQVETDVEGLDKRLHYLETTAKNSQVSLTANLYRLFQARESNVLTGTHRGNAEARRRVVSTFCTLKAFTLLPP